MYKIATTSFFFILIISISACGGFIDSMKERVSERAENLKAQAVDSCACDAIIENEDGSFSMAVRCMGGVEEERAVENYEAACLACGSEELGWSQGTEVEQEACAEATADLEEAAD